MLILLIITWFACGAASYGIYVNYFQRAYPTLATEHAVSDRVTAAVMGIAGPVTLVVNAIYFTYLRERDVPLGWKL